MRIIRRAGNAPAVAVPDADGDKRHVEKLCGIRRGRRGHGKGWETEHKVGYRHLAMNDVSAEAQRMISGGVCDVIAELIEELKGGLRRYVVGPRRQRAVADDDTKIGYAGYGDLPGRVRRTDH